MSNDFHDPFEQELLNLAHEYELSVRFNVKSGSVILYEHVGEWECAEQAVLYLKKVFQENNEV
jgi:hypothetical protein